VCMCACMHEEPIVICLCMDVDDDSDPMDFDNEVLDALAHLGTASATSFNIKTFKSIMPSAKSTPLAGQCSDDVCDSY